VKSSVVPALVLAALAVAACSDSVPYLFQAELYEPGNQCLDAYTVIDNIDGDDPGALCELVCLSNMGSYYVTTECAPYPYGFTLEGQDGSVNENCAAAFSAFARMDFCVDGGPPTNPLDASPDTAPPADAAVVDATAADVTSGDSTTE
jgi:hypothetical protein